MPTAFETTAWTMNPLRSVRIRFAFAAASALLVLPSGARATYHFMQIEQVIGGVDGNTQVQAIQLRCAVRDRFSSVRRSSLRSTRTGAIPSRCWTSRRT